MMLDIKSISMLLGTEQTELLWMLLRAFLALTVMGATMPDG